MAALLLLADEQRGHGGDGLEVVAQLRHGGGALHVAEHAVERANAPLREVALGGVPAEASADELPNFLFERHRGDLLHSVVSLS